MKLIMSEEDCVADRERHGFVTLPADELTRREFPCDTCGAFIAWGMPHVHASEVDEDEGLYAYCSEGCAIKAMKEEA